MKIFDYPFTRSVLRHQNAPNLFLDAALFWPLAIDFPHLPFLCTAVVQPKINFVEKHCIHFSLTFTFKPLASIGDFNFTIFSPFIFRFRIPTIVTFFIVLVMSAVHFVRGH